jgi:hypothetical protein
LYGYRQKGSDLNKKNPIYPLIILILILTEKSQFRQKNTSHILPLTSYKKMTDSEFDIMEQLYFMTSLEALARTIDLPFTELIDTLQNMHREGWIAVYASIDKEPVTVPDFSQSKYYLLATKAGLFAHNTR